MRGGLQFLWLLDSSCNNLLVLNSPGRFFAVNEVKALLAHVILRYDVKFEKGKTSPPPIRLGSLLIPRNANLLFRERRK
jgi:hypothetical protein